VHLPVGHGPHGLPVGISVVGSVGADRATLRAADWIHARLGGSEPTAE
jgi:Asp-tRNA(Asn)/Glu-tRNA(Gln) amidotransferase A subunit family amidase